MKGDHDAQIICLATIALSGAVAAAQAGAQIEARSETLTRHSCRGEHRKSRGPFCR
jgi:hypothetical protein